MPQKRPRKPRPGKRPHTVSPVAPGGNEPALFLGGPWDGVVEPVPANAQVVTIKIEADGNPHSQGRYTRREFGADLAVFALASLTRQQVVERLVRQYRREGASPSP